MFTKPRTATSSATPRPGTSTTKDDLRIKMCIEINAEDFVTIHHELGHNFYQRAYNSSRPLPRQRQRRLPRGDRRHHRAVDDAVVSQADRHDREGAGSRTRHRAPAPDGARQGGVPAVRPDVDKWRWKVFSGEITPDSYNQAWWDLRASTRVSRRPAARSEADFDPRRKFHVAGNVPYMRYFLADVLQFQFHRALCRTAGQTGPLNRCSIYGKAAGDKLNSDDGDGCPRSPGPRR
jgi:peptidyl-dipeptidase A